MAINRQEILNKIRARLLEGPVRCGHLVETSLIVPCAPNAMPQEVLVFRKGNRYRTKISMVFTDEMVEVIKNATHQELGQLSMTDTELSHCDFLYLLNSSNNDYINPRCIIKDTRKYVVAQNNSGVTFYPAQQDETALPYHTNLVVCPSCEGKCPVLDNSVVGKAIVTYVHPEVSRQFPDRIPPNIQCRKNGTVISYRWHKLMRYNRFQKVILPGTPIKSLHLVKCSKSSSYYYINEKMDSRKNSLQSANLITNPSIHNVQITSGVFLDMLRAILMKIPVYFPTVHHAVLVDADENGWMNLIIFYFDINGKVQHAEVSLSHIAPLYDKDDITSATLSGICGPDIRRGAALRHVKIHKAYPTPKEKYACRKQLSQALGTPDIPGYGIFDLSSCVISEYERRKCIVEGKKGKGIPIVGPGGVVIYHGGVSSLMQQKQVDLKTCVYCKKENCRIDTPNAHGIAIQIKKLTGITLADYSFHVDVFHNRTIGPNKKYHLVCEAQYHKDNKVALIHVDSGLGQSETELNIVSYHTIVGYFCKEYKKDYAFYHRDEGPFALFHNADEFKCPNPTCASRFRGGCCESPTEKTKWTGDAVVADIQHWKSDLSMGVTCPNCYITFPRLRCPFCNMFTLPGRDLVAIVRMNDVTNDFKVMCFCQNCYVSYTLLTSIPWPDIPKADLRNSVVCDLQKYGFEPVMMP